MNQSTTTSSSRERENSLLTSATEDEIHIAQILLDLKNLRPVSESLANFNWRCKRRRSCLDAAPPLLSAASQPRHSIQRTENEITESVAHIKTLEAVVVKHAADARPTASPDTPLSFSPSDESDEKSKHSSKKTSKKRSKEEYLDMIQELTKSRDLLTGELENAKKHYNKIKSYNSDLKEIKQQVLYSNLRKEELQMEISSGVNLGIELTQHHQQPFTADLTAQDFPYLVGPIKAQSQSSSNGLGSFNHVGPVVFDLNVPAEEAFGYGVDISQPFDVSSEVADKRARFAEARRKRRGIINMKTKSSKNGV